MASAVAQTCCIPIKKMELLRGELRLLKSAIEQLQGRFELLLSEIGDLQSEHETDNQEFAGNIGPSIHERPQVPEILDVLPCPEEPDAVSVPYASSAVAAGSEEMRPAIVDEPCASDATTFCSDPEPLGTDDAIASSDPSPVDDKEPAPQSPAIEAAQHSQPLVLEAAPATEIAVASSAAPPEAQEVADLSALPGQSCAIIVLGGHRKRRTKGTTTSARVVARWAAAAALVATALAVAVASNGFAYGFADLFPANGR